MLEYLNEADKALFLWINGIHNPVMDVLMHFISAKWTWIPVYAIILFFLFRKLGWKKALLAICGVSILILLSDQLSSGLLKPMIARLRPSHEPDLAGLVHLVNGKRGGKYGFVSSHSANFFALATYLSIVFPKPKKWLIVSCFVGASIVAYSRIYLGVHYPGDVICGGLLGIMVGFVVGYGYSLLSRQRFFS